MTAITVIAAETALINFKMVAHLGAVIFAKAISHNAGAADGGQNICVDGKKSETLKT